MSDIARCKKAGGVREKEAHFPFFPAAFAPALPPTPFAPALPPAFFIADTRLRA
jgi:hypothetical protein